MAGNSNNPGCGVWRATKPGNTGTTVMTIETPSHLHGLSIADKVSKLTAFIGDDLDARSAHGMQVSGGCYLLVARSPDSPVAQALRAQAARLSAMGIRVRAIFSEVDMSNPSQLMAPFSM